MPLTVGIAGITGKFARLVLKNLCRSSGVQIRGFCRNPSKLPAKFRDSPDVTIVQGSSDDVDVLRIFVRGCDVVICCYLGDNTLMTEGQKLLVDACDAEKVDRYIASDYSLDFTKLEYGQLPAKDPMKHVKDHLDSKKHVEGVHVLIGAFMETFWSGYFNVWHPEECKLSFYGNAAEYVAAVARDPSATGLQHFLGDRRSIHGIADDFAQVYGKKPQLERLGSLDDLYKAMQATFNKDPSNIFAYLAMFYQYYCTNGQAYLKPELDNRKYPEITPVTFKKFLQDHKMEELSDSYQNAGSDV
ncbi:NAD(P)-binding protein [Aspergillus campestris IBT 28561]|uniref:NAD(P)-binding protein n=1 Tax=Aspergillus campestris (strain IBT 28561) TaxID=1392248 RepID=A0A2I1D513_ASPC2|nr:NAD(P)-binding protein [Aspergillus campestris IBT 28561]PKY04959.1 NAD(P)-binding protein [Aspergillus campestris IBT 28561]